jgi:DNA-binding NarL/FixJ family response regulator
MKSIRVALLDANATVAARVGEILRDCDDIELAGHYRYVYELTQTCPKHQPDIVLINGTAPDADPLGTTRSVFVLCPGIRMLVMSGVQETATIRALIANGVAGYVSPDELLDSLPNTLRSIHAGKSVFSAEIMHRLLQ